ncbi:MAG: biopolymer transporter ExbD [Chlamydiota bacterium]
MRKKFQSLPDDDGLDEPLINLTPLIDVVFVVLITFMLIAPILDVDSVKLAPSAPAQKGASSHQNSSISISVHADNSIWYQNHPVTLVQLEKLLKEERKKTPNAIPQLLHDSRAQFGIYQSLKNSLEGIGFEQMDVVLTPG